MNSLLNPPVDGRPSNGTSVSTPLILPPYSGASTSSDTAPTTPTTTSDPNGSKRNNNHPTKRKRDAASDSATESGTPQSQPRTREGPKKKKANRACFHCQKAHLTCDDSRPCQRCIKRGMADNCTEGHRKKAKYLLDDEELEALKRSKSRESSKPADSAKQSQPSQPQSQPQTQSSQAQRPSDTYTAQPESIFASYSNPATTFSAYNNTTDAANLEYSIISSILGNSPDSGASGSPSTSSAQPPHQQRSSYVPPQPTSGLVTAAWPGESIQSQYGTASSTTNGYGTSGSSTYANSQQQQPAYISPTAATFPSSQYGQQVQDYAQQAQSSQQMSSQMSPPYPGSTSSGMGIPSYARPRLLSTTASGSSTIAQTSTSNTPTSWSAGQPVPDYPVPPAGAAAVIPREEPSSIYKSVTKPYDYTEGYHYLMKHLIHRGFEKNDILRVVRALAIFRPSLIALQMPMTEEDEVFVEKCFQRSLMELDKLISFSGTPTVAWRRTGEICLVGPEFCMLSGWEKEDLTGPGRRKYIYELFENQSVVEYWENFANHAFENTTQSVYSHCVLLRPNGSPVPCTFCFSIRRDIMDLPSLVIGQWLPLL